MAFHLSKQKCHLDVALKLNKVTPMRLFPQYLDIFPNLISWYSTAKISQRLLIIYTPIGPMQYVKYTVVRKSNIFKFGSRFQKKTKDFSKTSPAQLHLLNDIGFACLLIENILSIAPFTLDDWYGTPKTAKRQWLTALLPFLKDEKGEKSWVVLRWMRDKEGLCCFECQSQLCPLCLFLDELFRHFSLSFGSMAR